MENSKEEETKGKTRAGKWPYFWQVQFVVPIEVFAYAALTHLRNRCTDFQMRYMSCSEDLYTDQPV